MEDISVFSFPCPLTASLFYSSSYTSVWASVYEDPSTGPVHLFPAAHLHFQPVLTSCAICFQSVDPYSTHIPILSHLKYTLIPTGSCMSPLGNHLQSYFSDFHQTAPVNISVTAATEKT